MEYNLIIKDERPKVEVSASGPQGAEGPEGPQGIQGIQGLQGIQGIQGLKGDPGGWVTSTSLAAGTNLDTLITPGLYFATNSVGPGGLSAGHMTVVRTGGLLAQTFMSSHVDRTFFRRSINTGSSWSAWVEVQTGDTGWRNITSLATGVDAANTGTLYVRRTGDRVIMAASGLLLTSGTGLLAVYTLPTGFRPTTRAGGFGDFNWWRQNSLAIRQNMVLASPAVYWMSETSITGATATNAQTRPTVAVQGQGSFITDDTWPTTLPGTAA